MADLFPSLTDRINRMIRQDARNNGQNIIESIKEDAQRPATIDDRPQAYFEGRHASYFKGYLDEAYPRARRKNEILPVAPNYVRTWCETAADIYRVGEPQRIGATKAETARISFLCKEADTESVLPEAETRAHASQQIFLRVWRNPLTDRLEITRHWPNNVWVIASSAAPQHLQHCKGLLARRSKFVYELWRKVASGWKAEQIDIGPANPVVTDLFNGETYRGRLPWVSLTTSLPENCPYVVECADLIDNANQQMLLWSEMVHVARLQGHNPVWYRGADDDINPEAGPAGITRVGPDGELNALQVNPQLKSLLDLTDSFSGAIALSLGQSPRSFMTTPAKVPLNSGVALRVENQIREETRPQREALFRRMEREQLLPILDEVDRLMKPKGPRRAPVAEIDFDAVTVTFPAAPVIEDLSQRSLRMEHASNNGWISPARAAVESGFYDTIEQATSAGVSDQIERKEDLDNNLGQAGARGPVPGIQSETA